MAVWQFKTDPYSKLRRVAHRFASREAVGRSFDATDLAHDAWLHLRCTKQWDHEGHFLAACRIAIKRVLIDRGRHRKRKKRSADRMHVDLTSLAMASGISVDDLEALANAIRKLQAKDAFLSDVVELRYIRQLSVKQTAIALCVSVATIERAWTFARAWLKREIAAENNDDRRRGRS